MRIRAATVEDVQALTDVYLSSARHHAALDPGLYHVPDRAAVASHLIEALSAEEPERALRLVAEVDGIVAGSADVAIRSPGPESMLRPERAAAVGVAVLDDWRGQGIGSRLMEAAEGWAREHGASLVLLDASVANLEARRFYEERHGYRLRGVLLSKEIGASAPDIEDPPSARIGRAAIGAFGIILDAKQRVLLCHRRDVDLWNLPGGGVLLGETPWAGVVREVVEETGLTVVVEELAGVYVKPEVEEIVFSFVCRVVGGDITPTDEADRSEYFALEHLPPNMSRKQYERIADAMGTAGVTLKEQRGPTSRERAGQLGEPKE